MALFVRASNKCLFINNYSNKFTVINAESHKLFGFSKHCSLLKCSRGDIRHATTFRGHQRTSTAASAQKTAEGKEVGSFDKFLSLRRNEAERSVIVQVQSLDSYQDLHSYCYGFGPINSIQYYVIAKTSCFFMIEFEQMSSQKALMNSATHLNHNEVIPVQSQMLWFRNSRIKGKQKTMATVPKWLKASEKPSDEVMRKALSENNSISKQMEILFKMYKLDDVETRLRFFTAHQIESAFSSLFPNAIVLPFGSSVNGFGTKGCDLDLVLNLEPNKSEKVDSRLVFHTKFAMSQERKQTQRSMETISSVMQSFVPGVTNVRNILQAKVPIIKYDHILTGLECDLSMTNMTAVYMSELLYLYGESYANLRPLIFTIRKWASAVEVTNPNPGSWITNFSLSLLVIFFLQCQEIVPSLNTLIKYATLSDVRLTDECVDCTFLRDVTKWPVMSNASGRQSLEDLLAGFYHFYANFDFTTKAISVRDGTSIYKPDTAPLYICNPLEKSLNVSKNVTVKELMKFVDVVRNAAMLMDMKSDTVSHGLLAIFYKRAVQPNNTDIPHRRNKVCIADLFQPEDISENEMRSIGGENKDNAKRR